MIKFIFTLDPPYYASSKNKVKSLKPVKILFDLSNKTTTKNCTNPQHYTLIIFFFFYGKSYSKENFQFSHSFVEHHRKLKQKKNKTMQTTNTHTNNNKNE
jgi:hypothetical protein